jgi:putative nucleotidyltransferase with HDIG domain
VTSSVAAEVLTAMSQVEVPAEAVTAALLHDVGKLVLARFLTPELLQGLAQARDDGAASTMQAEATVLGVHHGELGGIIARHWNIPDRVCEAITHHHAPDRLGDVVCDVVALANVAAKIVEPVGDPATAGTEPPQGAATRLGLAPNFLDRLCSHVGRRVAEVLARFESRAASRVPARTR